jgi:hypothetical protein
MRPALEVLDKENEKARICAAKRDVGCRLINRGRQSDLAWIYSFNVMAGLVPATPEHHR